MSERQAFEEALHRLSVLAVQAPPTSDTLHLAAQTLRVGAGAKEAHILYVPVDDYSWASDPPWEEEPISRSSLGYVQRRLMDMGVPLGFEVGVDGRIEDLSRAGEARGQSWMIAPVLGRGAYADMLLLHGGWTAPAWNRVLRLLEASLPSISVLIGRFLDASESTRQRQQLNALSEVARAITETRDMETVLSRLANVIPSVTGHELAVLDVLAKNGRQLRFRCLNQSRWSDSHFVRFWQEWALAHELEDLWLEVSRSGQPALLSDLQHDKRVPPPLQEFFRGALLVSAAVLPVCFGEDVLGFLSVASPHHQSFPPEEVQLLEGLAAQAAAAIKAIQNFEALEASREQLWEYAERLHESAEMQRRLALTDALTNIPNRRYVEEFLAAEVARSQREGSPLAVVLADVDDFKRINDTFGHRSGDLVLIELARLAQGGCRAMDVAGRYGGDEFVFVLPLAALEHAEAFAQRYRARVARRRLRLGAGKVAHVTVSLGAAALTEERDNPDAILQSADEALYRAKALGKDQVCVAEESAAAA